MLSRLVKRPERVTDVTEREARQGVAIRFAASATYGEELFYLDIRCLFSAAFAGDYELVTKGERDKKPRVFERSCTKIAPPGAAKAGGDWYEAQYIVELPRDFGTLYADFRHKSSGRIIVRTRADRSIWGNQLIAAYYQKVRNPFVDERYGEWLAAQRLTPLQLEAQRRRVFEHEPLISLVTPAYSTPPSFLRTMIDSVCAQTYTKWELVIVNASPGDKGMREVLESYEDKRIRVLDHPENDGINGNTNYGIVACRGDYIGFIDHDDFIEPDLLFEYVLAINAHDGVDLLYCDEDSYEEKRGFTLALFKPDANLDLLYSNNYVVHLLMVSRDVIDRTLRSGDAMNGAQDYDLTLQAFHMGGKIVHIPKTLYHWRIHERSTNDGNTEAKPYTNKTGANALEANFFRRGLDMRVEETDVPFAYRCISNRDHTNTYVAPIVDEISCTGIALRNRRAQDSQGEYLLFASPSTSVEFGEKLGSLLGFFEREEVGVVAPRLVNPDGLVAQTGLVIRRDAHVTFMGHDLPASDGGYAGRFHRPCNFSAVSGDCCMMRRSDFLELGGYCEDFKTLLYASVDLCLRYIESGKLVVYTPFVSFEHIQRTIDLIGKRSLEQSVALAHDRILLKDRWPGRIGKSDPLFNPHLDETNPYFCLPASS